MSISVLDLFKIGIGPSSSHTVGPMLAAHDFVAALDSRSLLASVRRMEVRLYGSLAATGIGHGTDRAVVLGLMGERPDVVDPDRIGLVGSSFGAAVAVFAGGVDRRVAAVISCGGWGNGERKFRGQHPTPESWSRFANDPRFGDAAARRMHEAWVERAAKDGDEYMLLVAEAT